MKAAASGILAAIAGCSPMDTVAATARDSYSRSTIAGRPTQVAGNWVLVELAGSDNRSWGFGYSCSFVAGRMQDLKLQV